MPGRPGIRNCFHARGLVSLFAAASAESDGAARGLDDTGYEELELVFRGTSLWMISLQWRNCWWIAWMLVSGLAERLVNWVTLGVGDWTTSAQEDVVVLWLWSLLSLGRNKVRGPLAGCSCKLVA